MIHVIDISNSREHKGRFIDFGIHSTGSLSDTIPKDYENEVALLDPDKNFFFRHGGKYKAFIAMRDNKVVGRIAAMINPLINYSETNPGFVGLFETVENYEVSKLLLDKAIHWLKTENCYTIFGPMDFSIWVNYRFQSDNFKSKPFIGEPRNPPYYPYFFEKYGFKKKLGWQSRLLDANGIRAVMNNFKVHVEIFDSLSYSLVNLSNENQDDMMDIAYDLIMETYKNFTAFIPISREEFLLSYNYLPQVLDKERSYFVKNPKGEFIAFILVVKDLTDVFPAASAEAHETRSAIANLYQGGVKMSALKDAMIKGKEIYNKPLSISRAVLYLVFKSILDTGDYQYAIFPLMRDNAPNKKFSKGLYIQARNYYLFELKID